MLTFIISLAVFGLIMYLINAYIPMQPAIRNIVNIAAAVGALLWTLRFFGVF